KWLRPSLHFLHHPLWPGKFPFRADGRGGGRGPTPGRKRLCRNRADRRGSHLLWRGSSRHALSGTTRRQNAAAGARPEAAAAFLHRFHRGRSCSHTGDCGGRAADAAFPFVDAIGRRPDPEAHEAPPQPRRHDSVLRRGTAAAPGCGVWRRFHHRLSHRKRSDVREQPEAGGRGRIHPAACFSFFRPQRHAGGAHAPAWRRIGQGARRAASRQGRGGAPSAFSQPGRQRPVRPGGKARFRPQRMFRAGRDRWSRRARTHRAGGDHGHGGSPPDSQASRTGRRMRNFGEAPPEETGLFARLKKGLAKSSAGLTGSLTGLFTKKKLDAETVAGLEEALIRADMGVAEAKRLAAAVARNRYDSEISDAEVRAILAREIAATLKPLQRPLAIDGTKRPFVILVAGVNGTGKTTTIGKLARRL